QLDVVAHLPLEVCRSDVQLTARRRRSEHEGLKLVEIQRAHGITRRNVYTGFTCPPIAVGPSGKRRWKRTSRRAYRHRRNRGIVVAQAGDGKDAGNVQIVGTPV